MKYVSLALLFPTALAAVSATPTTSDLRQMIGREKVVTFSKDYLIKSGLDDKELTKFEATIKTSRSYIQPTKKEALLPNADRLLYTLDNAYAFIKEAVANLNKRYAQSYIKDAQGKLIPSFSLQNNANKRHAQSYTINNNNEYIQNTTQNTITNADLKELTALNEKAQYFQKQVLDVADQAFPRSYIEAQQVPDSWATAVKNQSIEEIFPNYKDFIKDYEATKFNYPLFKKNSGAKYSFTVGDAKSFTILLNNIERCDYKLSLKKLSLLERNNRDTLKKFALEIRKEYPTILSNLDFYKIARSTSMQRTVISAYAEAMEGPLNQIIRETNTLIEAAKKALK